MLKTVFVPAMLVLEVNVEDGDGAVQKAAQLLHNYMSGEKAILMHIPGQALPSYLHLPSSVDETVDGHTMYDLDSVRVENWPGQFESVVNG